MRRFTHLAFGVVLTACGHTRQPFSTTDDTLALDRVVLYRNGIGYFERRGELDGDMLSIKVRKDQVNDLLKSLTVVDRKSGKALSVSMPLDPQTWANAALAALTPGQGNLANVLDNLRGTYVVLSTSDGRIAGRIVMVEAIEDEAPPPAIANPRLFPRPEPARKDHRISLLHGKELRVVRLSKVHGITLRDGDLAMQLHRTLDASAGEGMFQQVAVEIRLAGARNHDVVVSYVVAAPMWKPTYRVVLPEKAQTRALLQAWAVVDNTSGEDWRAVTMSLTSGAPIAFRYDLHTPRTLDRSDLTEEGVRKRAKVAVGETSYDEAQTIEESVSPMAPEAPPSPPSEAAGAGAGAAASSLSIEEAKALDSGDGIRSRSARAKKRSMATASRDATGMASSDKRDAEKDFAAPETSSAALQDSARIDLDSLRRSTLASARASRVTGLTRFDLQHRVTVPDATSTMVAIVNADVEAEQTFLYRPGGAGTGYEQNPYRVVRFRNETPFVLEPGPISIYAGGSFVGEGVSEAVGSKTSATIPFAVEPTIMVRSAAEYQGEEMRIVRIVRGVLEVENFQRTTTTWNVRGQAAEQPYKVLIRHPRQGPGYEIKDRPSGTETLPDAYLVPIQVPAKATEASVKIVEQTPSRVTLTIWDDRVIRLLETLLQVPGLDSAARKRLEPIVRMRQDIGRIDTQVAGLQAQQQSLDQRAQETRANLQAIKKDPRAGELRNRLSKRLEEFTADADKLGRQIVELQSRRLEKKIELEDLLQNLEIEAPAPSVKKGKPQ